MAARAPKLQHARPLRDLETDGAGVLEQLRKTGEPVMLTEGDETAAVLMTAAQFEELTERLRSSHRSSTSSRLRAVGAFSSTTARSTARRFARSAAFGV